MSDITTPLPAAQAEITLAPTATDDLDKRQQIVTLSLTASQAPTATPSKSKSFPVAVAIPALVGGMALAIGGFLLYWYMAKRRRREKRLRWERHQRRRQRSRANTATSRPSISAQNSSGPKSPIDEKSFAPPVPALPKHAHPYGKQEYGYGYHNEYQNYPQQPSIEHPPAPLVASESQHARGEPLSSTSPSREDPPAETSEKPKSKSSKSAARIAAAEKAAEAAHGDINTRYQPKKPSPLALKAQERAAGAVGGPKWGDGPFRSGDSQLQIPGQDRQISGEWGVALGSPNHDAQEYSSYAHDPYPNARGKSGVYSNDPYSAYHNDEDVDYHQVADKMGLDGRSKQNWV